MILEGERRLDTVRSKLANCELTELKAKKKLKKAQKKNSAEEVTIATENIIECERQKKVTQAEGKMSYI